MPYPTMQTSNRYDERKGVLWPTEKMPKITKNRKFMTPYLSP